MDGMRRMAGHDTYRRTARPRYHNAGHRYKGHQADGARFNRQVVEASTDFSHRESCFIRHGEDDISGMRPERVRDGGTPRAGSRTRSGIYPPRNVAW